MSEKKELVIPDVVVAAPGYNPIVVIADREIAVSAHEPFSLRPRYTDAELEQSTSLRIYLDKKLLLPYKPGSKLPPNPTAVHSVSPKIMEKKTGTLAKTKVEKNGDSIKYVVDIPEDVQANINRVSAEARSKLDLPVDDETTPVLPKGSEIKHIGRAAAIEHIKKVAQGKASQNRNILNPM